MNNDVCMNKSSYQRGQAFALIASSKALLDLMNETSKSYEYPAIGTSDNNNNKIHVPVTQNTNLTPAFDQARPVKVHSGSSQASNARPTC